MNLLHKTATLIAATVMGTGLSANDKCPSWMNVDLQKLRSKETINLCDMAYGTPFVIVNTASQCGFTPQFEGLEALYQQYKAKGVEIIGFPSDSFMQEHDEAEKTAEVCYVNYGVTFTMLESSPVRGKSANSVFRHLSDTLKSPSWNFNKYLIDAKGTPIQKFGSRVKPLSDELTSAIEASF